MKNLADSIPTYFIIEMREHVAIALCATEWQDRQAPSEFIDRMYAATRVQELEGFDLTPAVHVEMEGRINAFLREASTSGLTWRSGFLGRDAGQLPRPSVEVFKSSFN